jgi:hypothetical protein
MTSKLAMSHTALGSFAHAIVGVDPRHPLPRRRHCEVASAELSRRVEKIVRIYPPLVEMDDRQRREFHEALPDADSFEDLPGKWQAAILKAEQTGRICG